MRTLRKILPAVIVSAITFLGTACDQTGVPTAPSSVVGVAPTADNIQRTTLWVNGDDPNGGTYSPPGTSCNDPGYPTVQSAVTAAAPGDRINVCPGTYVEEVTIPAGKDGIQLRSVLPWQAIIKAPVLMLTPKAIVRVSGAHNVAILAFTITGPGGGSCDFLEYGVRVDNAGSANILGNHITQIRDEPFSGCQNGVGIQVGRLAELTTGSALIVGNVIDHYQKNGMTVSNTGSNAEIAANQVIGIGPTAAIAQNGIQVSSGATASVRNNFVSQNVYTPQTFASTGVLLFGSGKVDADNNTVTSNDVGIYLFTALVASTITDNRVRTSTFEGVVVDASTGHQVAQNQIDHNGGPGVGVYDAALNNRIESNTVANNHDSGILLDAGINSNNLVSRNQVNDNGTGPADNTDGIRINAPSTGNTIRDNRLRHNVTHDCHDGSTGNSWINNRAGTSFPPGLCGRDRGGRNDNAPTANGLLQLQPLINTATARPSVSPDQ